MAVEIAFCNQATLALQSEFHALGASMSNQIMFPPRAPCMALMVFLTWVAGSELGLGKMYKSTAIQPS